MGKVTYTKRAIAFLLSMVLLLITATACSNDTEISPTGENNESSQIESSEDVSSTDGVVELLQNATAPKEGQTSVTMDIEGYGIVKIMLFDEQVPKSVENFVTLAKKGYYDGLTFHRIVEDFMIQGGDPTATGIGGESAWGGSYKDTPSDKLYNFTGALCFAQTVAGDITSQFYIVNSEPLSQEYIELLEKSYNITIDQAVKDKYIEVGGAPFLDGGYTVFGQVYEGLDVINAISKAKVTANESTGENSKPVTPVVINKITVE